MSRAGCSDETAVKLAANLARYGPRTLKGRKTLLFVDLSMNHLDMTGCYALEETLKKVDLGRGLCAIHGNPGFSGKREPRAPPLDPFALPGHFKSEEQVYYEAVKANGRNLRPIRSGGTSQTDSKTNLLNLRVPTPFLSPRGREASPVGSISRTARFTSPAPCPAPPS